MSGSYKAFLAFAEGFGERFPAGLVLCGQIGLWWDLFYALAFGVCYVMRVYKAISIYIHTQTCVLSGGSIFCAWLVYGCMDFCLVSVVQPIIRHPILLGL